MGEGGYKQINKALNICAFEDYLNIQQSRLPKLLDVEQISPRVIRVLGQNAGKFTLQGTNTYIVGTGAERMIVDTAQGFIEWADLISATLDSHSTALSHVLVTHWHGDHMGGVPDLVRMYPHLSSSIYKHTPGKGQQPIEDGQIFRVEGATIRAVHSPGHSHDHMSFVLEEENAMFTGDNVLGHGTTAVENLSVWMTSLRAMQAQNCSIGYPAHGEVISDLKLKIEGELAQKTKREDRIVSTLWKIKEQDQLAGRGKGSVTLKELVRAIHGEKNAGGQMAAIALEPFTDEVLRKLAEDGKAAFELRRGEKKWFVVDPV